MQRGLFVEAIPALGLSRVGVNLDVGDRRIFAVAAEIANS